MTAFKIDISTDMETVHPPHFCNTCNTKIRQYIQHSGIRSELLTTVWEPHSEKGCALCKQFQQRGRPWKFSREEAHVMEHLNRTTVQSWGDPKPLHPARFFHPAQGASLTDLQCIQCNWIPDRPVQSSCGKLVCYKCIASHFRTYNSELTCFFPSHPSLQSSTYLKNTPLNFLDSGGLGLVCLGSRELSLSMRPTTI